MSKAAQKNQSMDVCKLIASLLVLFLHVPFPGRLGSLLELSSRFAVPMFLAITGYFNYGASAATIARRMGHIVRLTILACVFYILSNGLNAWVMGVPAADFLYWNKIVPGLPSLMRWFILHTNPFSEHLWYLTAVTLCYFLLWLYVGAFGEKQVNYRPVYLVGLFTGGLLLYTAFLLPWTNTPIDPHIYRNGWITGIPLFTLGLFLHEYQDALYRNLRLKDWYLVAQMAFGFLFAICEWRCGIAGEVTFGHLIFLPALMILLIRHPRLPIKNGALVSLIARFRSLSTGIYIFHCGFIWVYDWYFAPYCQNLPGASAQLLRPLGVLALTLIATLIWEFANSLLAKAHK